MNYCVQWIRENGLIDFGGAKVEDFCKAVDIQKTTFYRWIKNDKTFATAIKEAKEEFKSRLETDLVESLARAAKGYTYTKTRTEYGTDKNGTPIIKKQSSENVDVAPNIGAAIFLLTNINGEKWRNKQSQEVKAEVNAEVKTESRFNIDDIPDEKLFAIADALQEGEHKRIMEQKNGQGEPKNE